jgi:ankyrin repeat protein
VVPRTVLFLLSFASLAAVPPDDWPAVAKKGDANRVEALLKSGAELEAKDQDGHTALMLAAQYGRADTVSLLLAKGARADARDRRGWIAYMLALLSPSGGVVHTIHDNVLKLLPQPHLRLAAETRWAPGASFFSSCFMRQDDLARHMNGVRPGSPGPGGHPGLRLRLRPGLGGVGPDARRRGCRAQPGGGARRGLRAAVHWSVIEALMLAQP